MKILIDTNILIDSVLTRIPFAENADKVLMLCKDGSAEGCISAHTVTNMFYVLRKDFDRDGLISLFEVLSKFLYVEPVDYEKLHKAITDKSFSDVEDCLQTECAKSFGANYIITRNIKDFKNSTVRAVEPQVFLELMK